MTGQLFEISDVTLVDYAIAVSVQMTMMHNLSDTQPCFVGPHLQVGIVVTFDSLASLGNFLCLERFEDDGAYEELGLGNSFEVGVVIFILVD